MAEAALGPAPVEPEVWWKGEGVTDTAGHSHRQSSQSRDGRSPGRGARTIMEETETRGVRAATGKPRPELSGLGWGEGGQSDQGWDE